MRKKKQVNVYMSLEWVEKLKELARKESLEEKKDISYIDLIRLGLQDYYNL